MKNTIKFKVPKGRKIILTATQIARELADIGHEISRRQVSKDLARGAPATSAKDYLAWKKENEQRTPRKLQGNLTLASLREVKLKKEIELLTERHIAEQRENRVRAGELVERSVVRSDMDKAASKAVAVMTQKFETELPPKQAGLPAEKIAEMNRAALQEIRLILSQPSAYAD